MWCALCRPNEMGKFNTISNIPANLTGVLCAISGPASPSGLLGAAVPDDAGVGSASKALPVQRSPRAASPTVHQRSVKISGLAIHQAPQTCFDTAAINERGTGLACISEGSSRPAFE